ncbi:MAG: DUF6048 family protein [Salinivirgaceae bacterium]|nr:DUF6048 family protein [Salinivirgaceae bacterium]
MWKYLISLLCLVQLAQAQVTLEEPKRQVFVRFGVDVSRLGLNVMSDYNHSGFEMSLDAEVKYRYFPTLEAGYNKLSHQTESINYQSDGNYFRLGLDYNILNYRQRFDRNLFFVGARYGFTAFSQQTSDVFLTNEWGTVELDFAPEDLSAHWVEAVIGLRGEIFKNFYMGYTIRVKQLLTHTEYGDIAPYWIPGFGKGSRVRTMGMSYSLFYAIPIKNPKPDFIK